MGKKAVRGMRVPFLFLQALSECAEKPSKSRFNRFSTDKVQLSVHDEIITLCASDSNILGVLTIPKSYGTMGSDTLQDGTPVKLPDSGFTATFNPPRRGAVPGILRHYSKLVEDSLIITFPTVGRIGFTCNPEKGQLVLPLYDASVPFPPWQNVVDEDDDLKDVDMTAIYDVQYMRRILKAFELFQHRSDYKECVECPRGKQHPTVFWAYHKDHPVLFSVYIMPLRVEAHGVHDAEKLRGLLQKVAAQGSNKHRR